MPGGADRLQTLCDRGPKQALFRTTYGCGQMQLAAILPLLRKAANGFAFEGMAPNVTLNTGPSPRV